MKKTVDKVVDKTVDKVVDKKRHITGVKVVDKTVDKVVDKTVDKKNKINMKKSAKKSSYKVSRKDASQILGVSIRTVDRYIKSKKIPIKTENKRVMLDFDELKKIKNNMSPGREDGTTRKRREKKTYNEKKENFSPVGGGIEIVEDYYGSDFAKEKNQQKESIPTFKKIYEELKEELREKQERLEMANYRVGQLESQIRNSVPMLEYHREKYLKEKNEKNSKAKLDDSKAVIVKLSKKLRYTKLSKRLYITILLIVLAMQPLWIIFFNSFE